MIRVAIVDDHAVVRAGLRQYLSGQVDLRVAGEACDGTGALELARAGEVDVMLLDIAMPAQSGIEALRTLNARFPALAVLVFSTFPEAHYAATVLRMGARGYVCKQAEPEQVLSGIRTVAAGRRYISAQVAEQLADALAQGQPSALPHELMSDRELQVFMRLARGETVGQIAKGMFLSVKTISTYRTRATVKLGLSSNSELTFYALRNGLIQ